LGSLEICDDKFWDVRLKWLMRLVDSHHVSAT
jgi:hypothetical protein